MNELETAREIASGALDSPQRVGNSSLVSLRVSGTGLAARPALREMVFRDPNVWLSPETLSRCAGLPIVIDHPKGSLTPSEYEARNVGSILYPYIADRSGIQNATGPDLWGIGRLFLDPDQIAALPDLRYQPLGFVRQERWQSDHHAARWQGVSRRSVAATYRSRRHRNGWRRSLGQGFAKFGHTF